MKKAAEVLTQMQMGYSSKVLAALNKRAKTQNQSPQLNCSLFITKVNFMANKFITVVMLEGLPLIKLTQGLRAKLQEQRS